jgi:archaellum biogenesis ATPase FlaH
MLIHFLQWFVAPLGYVIIPEKDCIIVHMDGVQCDQELCEKLLDALVEHNKRKQKDNVIRLDKYI